MTVVQEQITALERKVGTEAKSPLFARLADLYLKEGRSQDALRVCDNGLANHPYYTTGHLVKGKVLISMNMPTEARRHLEIVVDFLPGNAAARDLLASLPPPEEATLVVPELPPVEEKPKRRIEDMFQQITAAPPAVAEVVEIPTPQQEEEAQVAQTTEVVEEAPQPEEPSPAQDFGAPADEFGVATTETIESALPPEFASAPAQEPAVEETQPPVQDLFGGISGFTPDTTEHIPPTYVEPVAPSATSIFDEIPPAEPPPAIEYTAVTTPEDATTFTGFGFPEAPTVVEEATPAAAPEPPPSFEGEMLFNGPMDGDTYEKFALRMRAEMSGENTMSLEEFFSGAAPKPMGIAPGAEAGLKKDRIEEFAEKLLDAKKITPVINFSQKAAGVASEEDMPASTGFVTPTLAEIYAKQGWYDDAIKAYRTLIVTKPNERERFEKRIVELEEMKARSSE